MIQKVVSTLNCTIKQLNLNLFNLEKLVFFSLSYFHRLSSTSYINMADTLTHKHVHICTHAKTNQRTHKKNFIALTLSWHNPYTHSPPPCYINQLCERHRGNLLTFIQWPLLTSGSPSVWQCDRTGSTGLDLFWETTEMKQKFQPNIFAHQHAIFPISNKTA